MMRYLAITQGTAEWLLGKSGVLYALHNALVQAETLTPLTEFEFVEGPFRMSADADGLLAMWNVDYLTGTDEEPWGFIKLDAPFGIMNNAAISSEVLERCLYVANQRLQSLFIDGAFIHRSYTNGAHTCMAGRGSVARQLSIGYFERSVPIGASLLHSIVCVGPAYDFAELSKAAAREGATLDRFQQRANALIAASRKKAVAADGLLPAMRQVLRPYLSAGESAEAGEYRHVEVSTDARHFEKRNSFRAVGLSYRVWAAEGSPLHEVQRRILESDVINRHPLRIVGPGGSGKTLLLQLLAMRRLDVARQSGASIRVLYLVHNAAMADSVRHRFSVLSGGEEFVGDGRKLEVTTLTDYARGELGLEATAVISTDGHEAKQFQQAAVAEALDSVIRSARTAVDRSELFRTVRDTPELASIMSRLIVSEISTAIKGHGLEGDRKRYVQADRRLSRLHGLLDQNERSLVFDIYEHYHYAVFEQLGVLDADDIAVSLLGRLRTPIWSLKRREAGFDYVFVDETQLFNENERRLVPMLTTGAVNHVPVVLALDEAQDVYAQSTAGMATLGIPDIANESLASIHRSTKSIVKLAFFIIQRSTDLFGADFPDFTGIAQQMEEDDHPLAAQPQVEVSSEESRNIGRFVVKRIRDLRKSNLRQIAVICHSEAHYEVVEQELLGTDLPLHILEKRGERLDASQPLVVLTRPAYVGGQEFDAVVLVGLEQGVVPPRIVGNDALAVAIEQQSLRELYLSITRARYRLQVVLSAGATLTGVLQDAMGAGLLARTRA